MTASFREWSARVAGRHPAPHFTLATGANASTNIAVSGINVEDILVAVIENNAGTLTDRTATSSITSDGNIQCSASTAAHQVLVFWWSRETR